MSITKRNLVMCPRCGTSLQMAVESEHRGKEVIISYSHLCPVCRYKEMVEQINIRLNGDKIYIVKQYEKFK
ncbi:MAG: hypothetical protein QW348_01035 [Ignisphaera sp.]